jgi:twitching motility two-component system response regulator PilH
MAKVLIVDDSPVQLYHLRKLVEDSGHSALTVESGEQALDVAADERPEVILMDIVMPGMSGYTATRRLGKARNTQHIPVIFVTSKDSEADRAWGLRQGAREYVTKPVNPQILLAAISEAVAA